MKKILYLILLFVIFSSQIFIKANADNFLELLTKAQNAEKQGSYSLAINYYSQMINIDSKNPGLYALRASIYDEKLNNYKKAVSDYTSAIKYDLNNAALYAFRGACRYKMGDIDGALTDLSKSISINKKNGTNDFLDFAYCSRAVINTTIGNYINAINDSTEAIKIQPKYTEAFHWRGLAKMALALEERSENRIKSSIQDLNYAKEQCLEIGDMEQYNTILSAYKEALKTQELLKKINNHN